MTKTNEIILKDQEGTEFDIRAMVICDTTGLLFYFHFGNEMKHNTIKQLRLIKQYKF